MVRLPLKSTLQFNLTLWNCSSCSSSNTTQKSVLASQTRPPVPGSTGEREGSCTSRVWLCEFQFLSSTSLVSGSCTSPAAPLQGESSTGSGQTAFTASHFILMADVEERYKIT